MPYINLVWFCKSLVQERSIAGVQLPCKCLDLLVKLDGSLIYSILSSQLLFAHVNPLKNLAITLNTRIH
jgi:hypothetical protein